MTDTPKNSTDLLKQRFYSEKVFTLDDGVTEVTTRVNDAVIQRIRKYLSVLLELRGLVSLENLDESHPDVQKKLQARAKGNPKFARLHRLRRQGKNLKGEDLETYSNYLQIAVQSVRASQEPQVQLLLFQVINWSIMYDDLFSFEQGNPVFRLDDIEVPESYWTVGVEVAKGEVDPLDALLEKYSYQVQVLEIDRSNPLEWMLALVTTLVSASHNPKFSEAIQPVIQNAMYFVTLQSAWRDVSVDEAGFQLSELVGDLPEEVQQPDTDDVGEQPRRRVRKAAKALEPGGPSGQSEGQEA